MGDAWAIVGLFVSAFLAATLLPATSEAALAGLTVHGAHGAVLLIGVASAGNILGAVVNWAIGRLAAGSSLITGNRRVLQALDWFRRWGSWSLLLSWLPVIGDPLTLAAGMSRLPFARFLVPVAIGKIGRYAVVYWVTGALF